MLKNKGILLMILMVFLLLLIPNIVKAEDKFLSKIDVVLPKPIIGKKLATLSEVSILADDNMSLQVDKINWYAWDNTINDYKEIEDSNDTFKAYKKYAIGIEYKRPNEYQIPVTAGGNVADEFILTMNNSILDAKKPEIFMYSSSGDVNYDYDFIFYEFGYPDVEKNISTIDITIPKPEIGKKQYGLGDVTVKADKNEELEVLIIEWYKYNNETKKYELDTVIAKDKSLIEDVNSDKLEIKEFAEGDKFIVKVLYAHPNKYGYSKNVLVKVNEDIIDISNIEEFNPSTAGNSDEDWDVVGYKFEEIKKVVVPEEETSKDTNEEKEQVKENENGETKEEIKKEETKKDETAAPGSIPYAGGTFTVVVSSILLLSIGIYAFKRSKDLKGI